MTVSGARYVDGDAAGIAAPAGSKRFQPARMMLGLVSRPPSGCQRSRLSSKISRHRSASPRWVLAKPNRVSPATTVTWLPTSPTEIGGGAACAAATSVVAAGWATAVVARGAIGTTMSAAATSRWARKPTPRRAGGGGAKPAGGARRRSLDLLADFDDEGDGEPQPDQPRQHGEHADDEGDVVAQLEAGAAGPRVADEHDQQQRDADEQQARRGDRAEGAEQPSVHGALPTPATGEAVELDETDRPPGRMR